MWFTGRTPHKKHILSHGGDVGEKHDRGGNDLQVRWFTRRSNLHRVWDSGIIERWSQDESRWLDDLIAMGTPEARQKAKGGSVEEWVTASLLAARDAYQDPATGQRMKSGAKLGDAYYERSLLVAKRRLFEAGVRLAWVLNEVFPVE